MEQNIETSINNLFHNCGHNFHAEKNNDFTITITFDGNKPYDIREHLIYDMPLTSHKLYQCYGQILRDLSEACPVIILKNAHIKDKKIVLGRTSNSDVKYSNGVPQHIFHRDIIGHHTTVALSLLLNNNGQGRHAKTCFSPEQSIRLATEKLLNSNTCNYSPAQRQLVRALFLGQIDLIDSDLYHEEAKPYLRYSIASNSEITSKHPNAITPETLTNDILAHIPEHEKTELSWNKGEYQVVISHNFSPILHGRTFHENDKSQSLKTLDLHFSG